MKWLSKKYFTLWKVNRFKAFWKQNKQNKQNKTIIKKIIEEFETRRTDEIKNLGGIKMDALLLEGKINFARIRNSLDEMEMNKLEEEMKEEIKKMSGKKKKKAK